MAVAPLNRERMIRSIGEQGGKSLPNPKQPVEEGQFDAVIGPVFREGLPARIGEGSEDSTAHGGRTGR